MAIAPAFASFLGLTAAAHALNEDLPEYRPLRQQIEPYAEEPLPDVTFEEDVRFGDVARPDTALDRETPEIIHDISRLPEPVRRMRQLIIDACKSGDIERLRPLIGTGESATQLHLGDLEGDPIDFLRQISGDDEGHEIMAILLEVMESGFVHMNAGTAEDYFAWPYFFALPLDELTPPQRVELFTLLTAGDYEEMKTFGAYVFYRSAITADGRWIFFLAGD